jgi:CubicO group peptidase (beta-lactamase class C family)
MRRSLHRAAFCAAAVVLLSGRAPIAQALPPEIKERVETFVRAFGGGDPAAFEAIAREVFTPEAFARRTPDERRRAVEQVAAELGTLALQSVERTGPDALTLVVRGSKDVEARIILTIEPDPPHRIRGVRMAVGAGPEDGQTPPAPVNARMTREELAAALDAYLQRLSSEQGFSGAVGVAKNGDVVFEKAYGLADRAAQRPNTPATRFNLGSINKLFTQVAIGQLVAAGKLAFTDTIGKILSDYPNEDARAATVKQLIDHTAGLGDFFGPEFDRTAKTRFRSNADYVDFVSRQPLRFAPGARREYCNACYIVLGAIVEKVSGRRYEEYMAEHVFRPAGMTGAGFFASDAIVPDVAIGYTRRLPEGGEGELRSNVFMHGATGSAAGGGYARIADLLAFDRALRNGALLNAEMTVWLFGSETDRGIGVAGGAPGINAVLESNGVWTVAAAANLDPPAAVRTGQAIMRGLIGSER